jgi:hypothetical protein
VFGWTRRGWNGNHQLTGTLLEYYSRVLESSTHLLGFFVEFVVSRYRLWGKKPRQLCLCALSPARTPAARAHHSAITYTRHFSDSAERVTTREDARQRRQVSADDDTVAAKWAEGMRYVEGAAEKGVADPHFPQTQCGMIYAAGGRSVPQNWTTAAKWWRKAAAAGDGEAQWYMGQCYYYGRGVGRDVAQAMVWFRKAAAQGCADAVVAVQTGIPGEDVREVLARFTNAGSAPTRHAAAHEFVRDMLNGQFREPTLRGCNRLLQEVNSAVPHQSVRDGLWVDFMMQTGISEEDLALAKCVYAYSLRTCRFCGSNATPLRNCSLCMEARYCIAGDCQHADWNKTPAAESHKVLCPRIFVRGSKGRTRRA